MSFHRVVAILFFLAAITPVVRAQGAPGNSGPADPLASAFSQTIIVTAAAAPETLEDTPSAVTVITRDQIERQAARDLADVLRQVPGVQISRTGSPGKATSLFTRGANSTHTLVLWNGVEINNPYFSGYDWGRFSTAGIERVEVVRGPFSALYGSDAVSGVVNIMTVPAAGPSFDASIELGENDLVNGALGGSWAAGAFSIHGNYENRSDDGFAPNDDFAQSSALGGISWSRSPALSLALEARYTDYDLGVPESPAGDGSAYVPSPFRRLDGNELQFSAPVNGIAWNMPWNLQYSESRRQDDFSDPDDPYFLTFSSTESVTRRARASVQRATSTGTWTAGGEIERARVDDSSSYGVNLDGEKREGHSLFVEDRISKKLAHGSLEVTAGLRWDDFESFGSEASPRLSAAWINGRNKIRAGYGQAFRAPSVGELYFPFYGNPELDAEQSRSIEVGYERLQDRDRRFTVTLFRTDFDELIVYDNVTSVFQNVGAARSSGIELGAVSPLGSHAYTSVSYMLLDTEQLDTGKPLLRRPRHSGNATIGARAGIFGAELIVTYNGSRNDVVEILPYGTVVNEAYTVADFVVRGSFGDLTPWLRIENLTDASYEEVYGYPSPERRAIVGVRYRMR